MATPEELRAPRPSIVDHGRSAFAMAKAILNGADERTRTQRDALIAFMVRVASAAILYLSQVVLARWMGGHEYGIYVFVWTWVLVLGGLSPLGLNTVMLRMGPEYRERGQHDLLRGLLVWARAGAVALSTVITGIALVVLYVFQGALAGPYLLPAFLAVFCVPLYALAEVNDGVGRGNAWMGLALVPIYIIRPILILVFMVLAFAWGWPTQATTAAGAAVLATFAATLIQHVALSRRLRKVVAPGPRRTAFVPWFQMSLPMLVILACEIVLQTADVLIVSRYMTPLDVGIYFAAAKTMALIMFVHYAVGSAVANRFAALNARGATAELQAFVRDAVNWTFWPSLAGALAILVLGHPLLWLFGPQFTAGYPVMFILVLGFLGRAAMGPSEFLLNMVGEQRACAMVLGFTALSNIALNFALVPVYGLHGAASATAISLVMAALLNYVVVRRRLQIDMSIWANLGIGQRR
ncbi:MAG: polysaccharide biosynthesis C-terminal domain-containing protein [Pseudomonadota bacterium]